MKKFLLLSLGTLLVATACSKDETKEIPLEDLYQSIDQEIARINEAPPVETKYERITEAKRDGNKLIITSQINIDPKTYNEQLKNSGENYTITRLCKNAGTKGLLDKGAEIEYRYVLNDKSEVKVNVNHQSCNTL
ncbi:hypothetical protein GKC56_01585 [Neisseriaceae bacterium PsAf]|nr:hypothetical protein [Neisseriaceae bacterium PsAf]